MAHARTQNESVVAGGPASGIGESGLRQKLAGFSLREKLLIDTRVAWPWYGRDPSPMDGVIEQASWFGPADRPRFGWFTVPESGSSGLGVVLCPPFGEEARSAHRAFRRLGVELARRGIVALRLDYDGTGDSAGGQHEPDRVAAWKASIADAAAELRSMGLPDIALVGMRLGATLGAAVAAGGGFGSVVLWDPCASGRSYIREGQVLHRLGNHSAPMPTDGSVHTPGFVYDANTVSDLREVSLASLPVQPWCSRLLVLTRNGKPMPGPAGKSLPGDHVEVGVAAGQPELIGVEPNLALTPLPTLAVIADWLRAGIEPTREASFEVHRRTDAVVRDPHSGREVRERIVALGPNELFGVVSEPLDPRPDAPWIALVNVAIEVHLGPGRRWVEFSRAWAALGLRCVRFDQSGLGCSPRRPGQREDVMFDRHWPADIADAIDAFDAGDAPVAAFGLCSGAYSAFEGAMRRKLDAVYAVSPSLTIPQMAPGQAAHAPDRIAARPFTSPFGRLYFFDTRVACGLWRIYRQFAVWHAPMSSVRRVLRRGTTVRIVANRKDAEGYREVMWWSVICRRLITRTGRYKLEVFPDLDHALMDQHAQDLIHDDAIRFWVDQYGLSAIG